MSHTAVIQANSDATGTPTVTQGAVSASYDSGALVISSDGRSPHHQIDVDTVATSGTFAVAIKPAGSAQFRTPSTVIDLTDPTARLVVIENVVLDALRLTPVGVAADTDYTIAVSRHA